MPHGAFRSGVITVVLLAMATAGLFVAVQARRPQGDDAQQIRAVLDQGESAFERKAIGEAMQHVSTEYRDGNGFRRDTLRLQAMQALREADSVTINIPEQSLRLRLDPDGQHATVSFQVSLQLTDASGGSFTPHNAPLTLHMRKEPSRIFGIFPSHQWRVIRAEGYSSLGDPSE